MATVDLRCDTTAWRAAVREYIALLGDGSGLPRHLLDQAARWAEDAEAAIEVSSTSGRRTGDGGLVVFEAAPSGELLSAIATLRAIRGVR